MIVDITNDDKLILNAVQYAFRPSERPYLDISEELGIDQEHLLKRLRQLKAKGVIKRIGLTFNFRSANLVSALVGFKMPEMRIIDFSRFTYSLPDVKHNYLRDHPIYNVWFTVKDVSIDRIIERVSEYAAKYDVDDYIVLKSDKTFKLSVKFDLERGISWSRPRLLIENPPNLDTFGVRTDFMEVMRALPIDEDPFSRARELYRMDNRDILDLLDEMMSKGVIIDYGAYLDGNKIGFKHNAMVIFKGNEGLAASIAKEVPEATHIVYRETVRGNWEENVYFMIHGSSREVVDSYIGTIARMIDINSFQRLYSLMNLKVGG